MIMNSSTVFHTAIIGAGASGLFCAGSFSTSKIVLEANSSPAQKVAVSGGGKCNFSNRFVSAANYLSQNKHFCKAALAGFKPEHFTALLDQSAIPWEERENGQLFAKRATDITHWLLHRAQKQNTQLALGVRVLDIKQEQGFFVLTTSSGTVHAKNVVLATGGLSFPELGGNNFGFKMARKLGLTVVEPHPVLCGLMWPKELRVRFATLAGNSLPVKISQGKISFQGPLLFTHEGISGPAVLQLSLFWQPDMPVCIDFLPGQSVSEILQQYKNSPKTIASVLADVLPGKTARVFMTDCNPSLTQATRNQLKQAAETLHHFSFYPHATFGYTKAEATAGGLDTRELAPSTMQVRRIPGLFVIGEVMDVTGNLGGFNLHWAWASAFAAAGCLQKQP